MAARPTPREPRDVPSGAAVAAVCVLLALALLGGILWGANSHLPSEAEQRPDPTHDSMTVSWTHDGEAIRWYVMIDPDTGIQYLVNDRGGCCPRLDGYGNVMGVDYDG